MHLSWAEEGAETSARVRQGLTRMDEKKKYEKNCNDPRLIDIATVF